MVTLGFIAFTFSAAPLPIGQRRVSLNTYHAGAPSVIGAQEAGIPPGKDVKSSVPVTIWRAGRLKAKLLWVLIAIVLGITGLSVVDDPVLLDLPERILPLDSLDQIDEIRARVDSSSYESAHQARMIASFFYGPEIPLTEWVLRTDRVPSNTGWRMTFLISRYNSKYKDLGAIL